MSWCWGKSFLNSSLIFRKYSLSFTHLSNATSILSSHILLSLSVSVYRLKRFFPIGFFSWSIGLSFSFDSPFSLEVILLCFVFLLYSLGFLWRRLAICISTLTSLAAKYSEEKVIPNPKVARRKLMKVMISSSSKFLWKLVRKGIKRFRDYLLMGLSCFPHY